MSVWAQGRAPRDRRLAVPFWQGRELISGWEQRRSVSRSALAVRLAVLLSGLLVALAPAHPKPIPVLAILIGTLIAVGSPARAGAAFAVLSGIGGWFACYGEHGSPPVARTLLLATALYLLHSSAALAAAVPLGSRLAAAAALRWAARCLLHLAIAGLLVLLSYGVDGIAGQDAAGLFELAGMLGVVAILTVIVWLFNRTPR